MGLIALDRLPLRLFAFGYAAVLAFAAALNYIPGMVDQDGLVMGIFALDIYDDALHLVSALWALGAALLSRRASYLFLLAFGWIYFVDGMMGFLFGSGYLDLAIITFGVRDYPWMFKLLANLPHIGLGGFGIVVATIDARGARHAVTT